MDGNHMRDCNGICWRGCSKGGPFSICGMGYSKGDPFDMCGRGAVTKLFLSNIINHGERWCNKLGSHLSVLELFYEQRMVVYKEALIHRCH